MRQTQNTKCQLQGEIPITKYMSQLQQLKQTPKYKKIWMQPWGLVWVTCREDETQAPLLVIIKHQPASSSGENRKGSQTNIFFFALYFVIKHQHPRPEMRQEEAWQQMTFLFAERDSFCVQLKNVLQPFSWYGYFCGFHLASCIFKCLALLLIILSL